MSGRQGKPALGLYIHIPFCKAKCAYCDFYSLAHSEEKMDAYMAALLRHLEEVAPRAAGMQVDTVYFGGGTPSYLGAARLCRILQTVLRRYDVARDAEITPEANPDSAGDWKELRRLRLLPRPSRSLYLTRSPRLRRNRSRNLSPSQNLRLRRSLYLIRRIRLFPTCRIASV